MKTWRERWLDSYGWASVPNRGFRAQAKDGKAEILIYEQIGQSWWDGSGVGAKQFTEELKALGDVTAIDLRINSPGGDVTEADAIYTQLTQHPATINVFIDGLAASAASYIAMAGDTIAIAEHAKFMIHNASGLAMGNADEFRKMAEILDVFDSSIRTIYQRRTALEESKIKDWMDAETWFTGQETVDEGFADSIMLAKSAPGDVVQVPPMDVLERLTNLQERKFMSDRDHGLKRHLTFSVDAGTSTPGITEFIRPVGDVTIR